ncbi:hypothetical protein BDZ97DRAFT_1796103 [Flammula alnicola]|nr:hypothetical protein BDZ97DRAFT_1796103 [Flammula alnicola]
MQFSIASIVLFACATVFVSATPVPMPAPSNPELLVALRRENVANIHFAREAQPAPLPQVSPAICTKFQCN